MPPLRKVARPESLLHIWKAALKGFRNTAQRNGFKGERSTLVFFPHYTSARRFFPENKKRTRSLYDTWACTHLCARRGDPFAARTIARVLTQRLKVEQ